MHRKNELNSTPEPHHEQIFAKRESCVLLGVKRVDCPGAHKTHLMSPFHPFQHNFVLPIKPVEPFDSAFPMNVASSVYQACSSRGHGASANELFTAGAREMPQNCFNSGPQAAQRDQRYLGLLWSFVGKLARKYKRKP